MTHPFDSPWFTDLDAFERVELLRELREGHFDVLVGVNLLREGSTCRVSSSPSSTPTRRVPPQRDPR